MASAINKKSLRNVIRNPHPLLARGNAKLPVSDLVDMTVGASRRPSPMEAQRIRFRFEGADTPLLGAALLELARISEES